MTVAINGSTLEISGIETIQSVFASATNNPSGDTGIYLDRFGSINGNLEYYYYVLKTVTSIDVLAGADFTISKGALVIPDPGSDVKQFNCSGTTTIGEVNTDNDARDMSALICQRRLDSGQYNASEGFLFNGSGVLNLYGRIRVSATSRLQGSTTFNGKNGTIEVYHDGAVGDENVQIRFLGTNNHEGLRLFRNPEIKDSEFTGKVLLNNGTDLAGLTDFDLRAGLEMSNIQGTPKLVTGLYASFFQFFSSGAGFTSYVNLKNFRNPDIALPADISSNRQGMVYIYYEGDLAFNESDAYYHFKDTNNGNRPLTNGFDSDIVQSGQVPGNSLTVEIPYRVIHQVADSASQNDFRGPVNGAFVKYGSLISLASYNPKEVFNGSVQLVSDSNISENNPTVVDGYTNISTLEKLYDKASRWTEQNLAQEYPGFGQPLVIARGFNVDFGNSNLIFDGTAPQAFSVDIPSNTITINCSTLEGSFFDAIETTGTITFQNGADYNVTVIDSSGIRYPAVAFVGFPTGSNDNGVDYNCVLAIRNTNDGTLFTTSAASGTVLKRLSEIGNGIGPFLVWGDGVGLIRTNQFEIQSNRLDAFSFNGLFDEFTSENGTPIIGLSPAESGLTYNEVELRFELASGSYTFFGLAHQKEILTSSELAQVYDTSAVRAIQFIQNDSYNRVLLPPPFKVSSDATAVDSPIVTDCLVLRTDGADPFVHDLPGRPEVRVNFQRLIQSGATVEGQEKNNKLLNAILGLVA